MPNTLPERIPEQFRAFRIHDDEEGYRSGVETISPDDLGEGDVTIQVHYSSANYKDALAATGQGRILRQSPLIGGIDVAGVVLASDNPDFKRGDAVLVTGSGLSETVNGGYSEYLKLDSRWVVPLPDGMDMEQAMVLGTAGFTAALSLYRMEALGQTPEAGPIVVTGASGGVGSLAISILSGAGYDVHAISGKVAQFDYLESLGATQCISRHELYWGENALESARWAGAIDNVGGDMLNGLTRVIKPWGNIACCGLAGGAGLQSTVYPLIIRGVSLIGINSSGCLMPLRQAVWERLAGPWKPTRLGSIHQQTVTLEALPGLFETMLQGESLGRVTVRLADSTG